MPERGVSEKHLISPLCKLKSQREEVHSNSIPNADNLNMKKINSTP
jgi:hypothetical protein